MKLKKWVKVVYLLVILFCVYLIYGFLLYNNYNKYRNSALHLTENGKLLTAQVFPNVRVTKAIYILDSLSLGNNFESINKENDSWKITDKDNISYKLKVKEMENDNYKMYQYTISNLESIKNLKISVFSSTTKKKEAINLLKNINKYVPQYEEIFLIDGNKKHGVIYKSEGKINSFIFIGERKYQFIFDNDFLTYDYIIKILASLTYDE